MKSKYCRGRFGPHLVPDGDRQCMICKTLNESAYRAAHRDKYCELGRKWRRENAAHAKELDRLHGLRRRADPVRHAAKLAHDREYGVEYRQRPRSKELHAARETHRRSLKIAPLPTLLDTPGNGPMIGLFYHAAKLFEQISGEKFHVDHIRPLQGKYVPGFHEYYNLQVLPGADNVRKSNKESYVLPLAERGKTWATKEMR